MDPTQVQRLKLNINNIKSVLTESTGDLKDAKKKKRAVIRAKIDEEKRLAAEKKLEKKSSPLASIGKTIGKAAGSVKDAFGKVIEFGALVLFGSLVSKLPAFEKQWKEFTEKYKPLFEKLGQFLIAIRDSVTNMIDAFVAEPFADNDFAQFDENNKLIDGKLKELDDMLINIQKMLDDSGIANIAKKLIGYDGRSSEDKIRDGELLLKEALKEQDSEYVEGDLGKRLNGSVSNNQSNSVVSNNNTSGTENNNGHDSNLDKLTAHDNNSLSGVNLADAEDALDGMGKLSDNISAVTYTMRNNGDLKLSESFNVNYNDDSSSVFGDIKLSAILNNKSSVFDTLNKPVGKNQFPTTVYFGTQIVEKIVPVA